MYSARYHCQAEIKVNTICHCLIGLSTYRMYPKERANTPTLRTWRHSCGHLEVREPRPNARLIYTEHGEVFRLHIVDVRLICNS